MGQLKIISAIALMNLLTWTSAPAAEPSSPELRAAQVAWVTAIAKTIRSHWTRPYGDVPSPCKLQLRLDPDGKISAMTLLQSCGSERLDQSIKAAAILSEPLPLPSDPAAFESLLTLNFIP